MFGWDDAQDNFQQVHEYQQQGNFDNKPELSHEVLAGGASFLAMHEFENHMRNEGKPVDHAFAKEALAGFAGVAVDRFAETQGEDWVDRERAKRQARDNAEQLYDQQYGGQDQYDPNQDRHPHLDQFGGGRY